MNIGIVTPAPPQSRSGNRVTAIRWARILRKLGHRVNISESYTDQAFDMLVALHARRSFHSIRRFRSVHPDAPLIVALTGTDLYRDLSRSKDAQTSLNLATRIVVLQPQALVELRPAWRRKARVVYQSVSRSNRPRTRRQELRCLRCGSPSTGEGPVPCCHGGQAFTQSISNSSHTPWSCANRNRSGACTQRNDIEYAVRVAWRSLTFPSGWRDVKKSFVCDLVSDGGWGQCLG